MGDFHSFLPALFLQMMFCWRLSQLMNILESCISADMAKQKRMDCKNSICRMRTAARNWTLVNFVKRVRNTRYLWINSNKACCILFLKTDSATWIQRVHGLAISPNALTSESPAQRSHCPSWPPNLFHFGRAICPRGKPYLPYIGVKGIIDWGLRKCC